MLSLAFRTNAPLGALVVLFATPAFAQLRVATWNITNYAGGRTADIQNVVYAVFDGRSMTPDLILGQEFLSASAVNSFLLALNNAPGSPGDWAAATFVDGPDSDSAFFYRTSKTQLLGTTIVAVGGVSPNHPRNIMRYDVRLAGYAGETATLACYSTHMKAGSSSEDQARRLVEAQRIRDNAETLHAARNFLLGGDFNIQSSTQAAYQELVGSQPNNAGRFFDPIRTPGSWNNNSAFRFVHTQDPIGAGGMDDRHDQILLSAGLIDGTGFDYIGDPNVAYSTVTWNDPAHSYRSWGNDGTSFDATLRVVGNTMVGPIIAQSLINTANGAGHLPVFLDLRVPPQIDADLTIDFGQVPLGSPAEQSLFVANAADVALWSTAGIADLEYQLIADSGVFTAPAGMFAAAPGAMPNEHLITLDTQTAGKFGASLAILSNAADDPLWIAMLVGEVVAGAGVPGDLNCDGIVTPGDIAGFVLALTNPAAYEAQYPNCISSNADINQDGVVSPSDIAGFVALLTGL